MDGKTFDKVIEDQITRSTELLFSKNADYNPEGDKLNNFKVAGALQGESSRAALAGMMAKHTGSVFDMCMSDRTFPAEVWDEKITDHINYLLLLRAVVEEELRSIPEGSPQMGNARRYASAIEGMRMNSLDLYDEALPSEDHPSEGYSSGPVMVDGAWKNEGSIA